MLCISLKLWEQKNKRALCIYVQHEKKEENNMFPNKSEKGQVPRKHYLHGEKAASDLLKLLKRVKRYKRHIYKIKNIQNAF